MVASNSTTYTFTIFLEEENTEKSSDDLRMFMPIKIVNQTSIVDACGMRNKNVHMASKSFLKENI
jgi:hypothetical protein